MANTGTNPARTGLTSLSNELVGTIALHLGEDRTLLDLSLVNKHLRSVAQDAMLRQLCVPKKGISQLLAMLMTNPSMLSRVRHLNLQAYTKSHEAGCQCLDLTKPDARIVQLFHNLITKRPFHGVTWNEIEESRFAIKIWRERSHDLWLELLVILLPSLKEVTLWLPPHGDSAQAQVRPDGYQHSALAPFEGLTLRIMQDCLQVLTITSDAKYTQNTAHVIQLPGFRNLRFLTMPMEHLGSSKGIGFYNSNGSLVGAHGDELETDKMTYLPLTLTALHLTACTKSTFALLDVVNDLPSGNLRLKHITLSFDMAASSALILCTMEGGADSAAVKAKAWVQTLADLAGKGISMDFHAAQAVNVRSRKATFVDELQAMTVLHPCEVAKIAQANMQFSDCVARSSTGLRERSSALEYELFIRHGTLYPVLFSSRTFKAEDWIDVAFFHGMHRG